MKNNIHISNATLDDFTEIQQLFYQSFKREITFDFWQWRFLEQAHQKANNGKPLIKLAWDKNKLIGQYAASWASIYIDGTICPAGLSMSTMTHPDYRGQGILEQTALGLYADLSKTGFAGVWGFPNQMINATRQKKLGWKTILDVLNFAIEPKCVPSNMSCNVEIVDEITDNFVKIHQETIQGGTVCFHRDLAFYKWRVDQNPQNEYVRFIFIDNITPKGFAIVKPYGLKALDIVEFRFTEVYAGHELLSSVMDYAKSSKIDRVNIWATPGDPNRHLIEKFGFVPALPITFFGGRLFEHSHEEALDGRNWNLSMLDSDVY